MGATGVRYALGLDLGTSTCKAVALTPDGQVLAACSAGYRVASPQAGWAEQHPRTWWAAARRATRLLLDRMPGRPGPAVIGVTGQMHGLVALDSRRAILRPAILWSDQRSGRQAAEITGLVGEGVLRAATLNPSRAAFTASKLLWLRENEPDRYVRARHVLLPKDWLVHRLTGDLSAEPSDASGTGLFDVPRSAWSERILRRLDFESSWFAPVRPSSTVVGTVSPQAGRAMGIPAGVPVVAGGGDQATAALAAGAAGDGVLACNLGTSAVLLASLPGPGPGCLGHVLPGTWLKLASAHSGMASVDWWSTITGGPQGAAGVRRLLSLAAASPPGARGATFLPFLMGTRDQDAAHPVRAAFGGLRADHSRADLTRAVLEGMAFELRRLLATFTEGGIPCRELRVIGGGSRAAPLIQLIAEVLRVPLLVLPEASSATGAAMLALRGVGDGGGPAAGATGNVRSISPQGGFDYEADYAAYRAAVS